VEYLRVYGLVPGARVYDHAARCPATVERVTVGAMLVLRYGTEDSVPAWRRGTLRQCDPVASQIRLGGQS
jgi:hypothetical protein